MTPDEQRRKIDDEDAQIEAFLEEWSRRFWNCLLILVASLAVLLIASALFL